MCSSSKLLARQVGFLAYHFTTVKLVNLLPATDDSTVHSHGLIDHAQGCAAVEAILCAMVYGVRLVDSWALHCPGLFACHHKQELIALYDGSQMKSIWHGSRLSGFAHERNVLLYKSEHTVSAMLDMQYVIATAETLAQSLMCAFQHRDEHLHLTAVLGTIGRAVYVCIVRLG